MFTTWIVGVGTLPNGASLHLGMVIGGSEGGTMNREGVTFVLIADSDTMVGREVGCFIWAPQAEIEVFGLRSRLGYFNDEAVGRGPVFILEKLLCEVMCF